MKKMLEYQKLDMELNKLKKSSLNSSDRANLEKLKGIIVEYHNKGFQLESGAKSLIDEYAKLKDQNVRIIFEPNDTILQGMRLYAPRKVFL